LGPSHPPFSSYQLRVSLSAAKVEFFSQPSHGEGPFLYCSFFFLGAYSL